MVFLLVAQPGHLLLQPKKVLVHRERGNRLTVTAWLPSRILGLNILRVEADQNLQILKLVPVRQIPLTGLIFFGLE